MFTAKANRRSGRRSSLCDLPLSMFWEKKETCRTREKPGKHKENAENSNPRSNQTPRSCEAAVPLSAPLGFKQYCVSHFEGIILLTTDPSVVLHQVLAPLKRYPLSISSLQRSSLDFVALHYNTGNSFLHISLRVKGQRVKGQRVKSQRVKRPESKGPKG